MTLKRSYIRRKPRRNRPEVDWPHLQELVRRRDAAASAAKLYERLNPLDAARMIHNGDLPCVAWIIEGGPIECTTALGWRLDHIKETPRLGVKGSDSADTLVSLCSAHDERGAKAGFQWNTANRPVLRAYLEQFR